MNIDTYLPNRLLSPFIKTYLILESNDESVNRVLPDTSLVMAFRYKGQVSYKVNGANNNLPSLVVSGLRKSGRLINYSRDAGNILVIFKEAAAHAFIKEPLHELFEESVSLGDLHGYKSMPAIEEQLAEASDNKHRINLIEQFLTSRLYNDKSDTLILTALERIHLSKGIVRVKELADTLCIGQDAFEKRFRKVVGVSPKQFSYIVKMRSIISNGPAIRPLAETAYNAGYFDQAHFNKDFKLFTGQTPTDFLKSPAFW